MDDSLVQIASFASATEAAVAKNVLEDSGIAAALDGEAAVTCLWYIGTALNGVRLFVRAGDVERANAILCQGSNEEGYDEPAEDAVPSEEAEQEDEEDDDRDEELCLSPTITRAWRAAVVGIIFLPVPILNLYSMWLLADYCLFTDKKNQPGNWRVIAAFVVNVVVIAVGSLLYAWMGSRIL